MQPFKAVSVCRCRCRCRCQQSQVLGVHKYNVQNKDSVFDDIAICPPVGTAVLVKPFYTNI